MTEFDEPFSDATTALPHPFKRRIGDPTVIGEKSSPIFSRHVDDGLAVGTEEDLDIFFAELEATFAKVVLPPIVEEKQQHLGVFVSRTKDGFRIRDSRRLVGRHAELVRLDGC